jgi:hypothetical protein
MVRNRATAEVGFEWRLYEDFRDPVPQPLYIPEIKADEVIPLSIYTAEYDMVADDGFKRIGMWIDQAAIQVGR